MVGDFAGELVSDEVEDSEIREVGDAAWDFSGYALPIGDCDAREARELADFWRYVACHVPAQNAPTIFTLQIRSKRLK